MKRRERYNKSVYRSLAMFMQFGLHMLVPICMMSALGVWLDRKLGTSYIMIALFFVGVAAGAQNVYRLAGRPGRGKDAPAGRNSEKAGAEEEPAHEGGAERKNGIGQDTGGTENDQ